MILQDGACAPWRLWSTHTSIEVTATWLSRFNGGSGLFFQGLTRLHVV